jgi:oligosaccharide repeat unit polymerase
MHPVTVLVSLWTIGLFIIEYSGIFYDISFESKAYIFFCLFAFAVGGACVELFPFVKKKYSNSEARLIASKFLIGFFFIMLVVGALLVLRSYFSVILESENVYGFFRLLREKSLAGVYVVSSPGYLLSSIDVFFPLFSLLVYYEFLKKPSLPMRCIMIISIFISVLLSIKQGARSGAIQFILSLLVFRFMYAGVSFKVVAKYVILMLLVFLGVGFLLQKGVRYDEGLLFNIKFFAGTLFTYAYGGVAAFGDFFQNEGNYELSFRFYQKLVQKWYLLRDIFGLMGEYLVDRPSILPHLRVGPHNFSTTNVFTFLSYYVDTFSRIGAVVVLFLQGVFYSIIYKKADYSDFYKLLYSLVLPGVLLSTFSEYFFDRIPVVVRGVLLIYIIYKSADYFFRLRNFFISTKKGCA